MIKLDDFKIVLEGKNPRKLFKMFCDRCGLDRGYQRKYRHGLGLCRSCASSLTHKNKTVSDETRLKMRLNNHLRNGGSHPLKGKKHKTSTKLKLSMAAATQNKNYVSKHLYKGPQGEIFMKSSWEVKYAHWLDKNGIKWTYEPRFKLSNGYSYIPDFQLSTGDIIEIKGYMRKDALVKWDLFCADYPTLKKSLLRKYDLKKIGVI
jgi:ribosomal protein S14